MGGRRTAKIPPKAKDSSGSFWTADAIMAQRENNIRGAEITRKGNLWFSKKETPVSSRPQTKVKAKFCPAMDSMALSAGMKIKPEASKRVIHPLKSAEIQRIGVGYGFIERSFLLWMHRGFPLEDANTVN